MAADKMDRVEDRFKQSQAEKEGFEADLEMLDKKIARLRVLYDQYFMGIEKMEPTLIRGEAAKFFMRSTIPVRGGTALKFRFRSLQQRFVSYCSYWDRVVRLIEDGKIRRGINSFVSEDSSIKLPDGDQEGAGGQYHLPEALASKRRRFKSRTPQPGQEDGRTPAPPQPAGTPQPAAASQPAPAAGVDPLFQPPPAAARVEGLPPRFEFLPSEVSLIAERLREEKARVGEPADKITAEMVEKSIRKMTEKLAGMDLRLRLIEKDGRVSLAAVIKKS